jgi:hypothetical protein
LNQVWAKYGILKVGILYQQQLRMHAWKFQNDRLPDSQAAMLARVGESHSYGTRAARSELLVLSTGDHRLVGYRISDRGAEGDHVERSSRGDFLV